MIGRDIVNVHKKVAQIMQLHLLEWELIFLNQKVNVKNIGYWEILGQIDGVKKDILDFVERKKALLMEHVSSDMMQYYHSWRKVINIYEILK